MACRQVGLSCEVFPHFAFVTNCEGQILLAVFGVALMLDNF